MTFSQLILVNFFSHKNNNVYTSRYKKVIVFAAFTNIALYY